MLSLPTVERLRELLSYDPDTGEIRWKVRRGRQDAGTIAGTPDGQGYWQIQIDGQIIGAHRVAWALYYGAWAPADVDHEDLNGLNNAICNLRPATRAQNMANAPLRSTNTSGFKGVSWCKQTKKWSASIMLNGKHIRLGRFHSPEDASAAYQRRARELWGEYVRAC